MQPSVSIQRFEIKQVIDEQIKNPSQLGVKHIIVSVFVITLATREN